MSSIDPRTRRVKIKVELIRWDWTDTTAKKRDSDSIDITQDVVNYRFQETIKTPMGTAQLALIPQRTGRNMLDIINVMDVIKIYEFDTLKFQGYVRRVSYSGSIQAADGKPSREAVLSVTPFGGMLFEPACGLGMGRVVGNEDAFQASATVLMTNIANVVGKDGAAYGEVINTTLDAWFEFIKSTGGPVFDEYVNTYMNFSDGVDQTSIPVTPRQFDVYTGKEESVTIWSLLQKLTEIPLNELWVDSGPRSVYINGVNKSLGNNSTYLIFRDNPFDAFDSMPFKTIDKDHYLRFDFAKSMDESFSVFGAIPVSFDVGEYVRQMLGTVVTSEENLNKYLYKPMINQLHYTRKESEIDKSSDSTTGAIDQMTAGIAEKLKRWFENNDKYYSGAITMMVPKETSKDPRIGERVAMDGLQGWFYVEGVAHTWQYPGALTSNLSVTRGWNRNRPLEFKDKIFRRGQGQ